ncbi:MAG: flagellar M-ring protein FliF, partial [Pseudomonadota bacterium]|nr:flagellar M-ring protein FliF [Pseudomonadota bacterium]
MRALGPVRLTLMAGVCIGVIAFMFLMSSKVSPGSMALLYGDLTSGDAAGIAGKLETSQISYRISDDGARIFVPDDQVGRVRMLLASEGLPSGGTVGYEIF